MAKRCLRFATLIAKMFKGGRDGAKRLYNERASDRRLGTGNCTPDGIGQEQEALYALAQRGGGALKKTLQFEIDRENWLCVIRMEKRKKEDFLKLCSQRDTNLSEAESVGHMQ